MQKKILILLKQVYLEELNKKQVTEEKPDKKIIKTQKRQQTLIKKIKEKRRGLLMTNKKVR